MKVLLTLILTAISFMLTLWRQALYIYSSNPTIDGGYWAAFGEIFSSSFNKPATQLLLFFLIMAPTWAVFTSRTLKKTSRVAMLVVVAWLLCNVLFAMDYLPYSSMGGWFIYGAVMLLAGLLIMLYRIFSKNVEYELQETQLEFDEQPTPRYTKNKTWY